METCKRGVHSSTYREVKARRKGTGKRREMHARKGYPWPEHALPNPPSQTVEQLTPGSTHAYVRAPKQIQIRPCERACMAAAQRNKSLACARNCPLLHASNMEGHVTGHEVLPTTTNLNSESGVLYSLSGRRQTHVPAVEQIRRGEHEHVWEIES